MKKLFFRAAVPLFCVILAQGMANAREQIQIAGSSTVLPYAKIVAETFGEIYPDFKVPVIESGGSGAGIKEFCRGVGERTIDIANTSRAMKPSELQSCFDAGVTQVQEVRIGYDGIVFATDINSSGWALDPIDIYRALAAQVVVDGKLQPNKARRWSEVNSTLPDWAIAVYIPGEKHGTREVFEEKLMMAGCVASGAKYALLQSGMEKNMVDAACIAVRKDGRAVDIDGDYAETLARISSNRTGIGVFGFAFYENNADRLKIASISGVVPSVDTIANGNYPVSRPLYFYVKKEHVGVIPGLREYIEFFLSDQMVGPDGPLAEYGLIAAPEKEREAQRAAFEGGVVMMLKE